MNRLPVAGERWPMGRVAGSAFVALARWSVAWTFRPLATTAQITAPGSSPIGHRPPATGNRFILPILLIATAATAAPMEIDRAVAAVAGTEAQFTQRFTPKGFKNSQVESGSVVFGTLPMMRWSYTKPEEKLFVFDGSKSWFYVPADKQVTVGRIDDARKGELPFLLLSDPVARDKYFTIREQPQGRAIVTTLQSRDANTMVREIVVTTSAATHQIQRIDYDDRQGNRTSFELSGYHPKSTPAETFRFNPPAGVLTVNSDQ